ncbi:MAG: hypothetical protein U9R40_00475 [Synergistota bacterium]|nr:hypothetical protein [Synergistota bacterium]
MRRKTAIFSFLMVFTIAAFCLNVSSRVAASLVFQGDHAFPPYEFLDGDRPSGFNVDMVRALAEKTIMNGRIDIFYAILAFLGLASLLFSVFLKPYRTVAKHRVTMKGLVSVPAFRGLLMLAFSGAMVICVTNNFMALLLVERGIPVSAFFIPFALATLALRGPLAFWVERCDPRRVVVACFVVMAAAGLAGFAALGSARWLFTRGVARRMVRHKRETHG